MLLYLTGIFFMGLKPPGAFYYPNHFHHDLEHLFVISKPPIKDFIINILGFCPLDEPVESIWRRLASLIFVSDAHSRGPAGGDFAGGALFFTDSPGLFMCRIGLLCF